MMRHNIRQSLKFSIPAVIFLTVFISWLVGTTANWRKLKGICRVKLHDGTIMDAEVHWYEGHGIGKREIKIKKYL